jgi:integrase
MRGHIKQRTKGSWSIIVDVGRDPKTGKRRQQWRTVKGSKRAAETKLRELLQAAEKGVYIKPQRLNMGEYLQQWLDSYVKTNCTIRTLDGYQYIVTRHLMPALGKIPLVQVQPHDLQQYYSQLLINGRVDGKGGLSARTVLHFHRVLFQAFKYAVRQGFLIRNIAELVDPPRSKKRQMKTLTPQEVSRLLTTAKDSVFYPIIYTAVNTGLRQAELLGLRWHDLDLDLASLSVSQVLYKRRGVCIFKGPKSEHSRRRLDLTPSLALFLRKYREGREAEQLLLGKSVGEYDLVFSNIDGIALDPGTLTHTFAKISRNTGLPGTRFHDLRHTFASIMLLTGIHPKIVSEMLGHASVAFTLDTYSHVIPGLQKAAVKRLDEVLHAELNKNEDVSKMLAKNFGLASGGGASERSRTPDRLFTKQLLYH